jgi:PAS domain S-box-containing protein
MSGAVDPVRVLHVDDNADFADLTTTILEREDDRFVTETATSATEALNHISERQFDCIVSDYDMPDQNGIEFLRAVRETCPDLPFILYTGKGSEEVASEAISAGVTDYLQKGTGTSQYTVLANRIQNAVSARRSAITAERRRHRFEQILKTVPGCVVQLDADGQFVFANERAEEVLGLESDEVTDRTYNDPRWELQDPHGDPIPDGELPFRRIRETGEPVYAERLTIQWPDGTRKLLLVNGAPVSDENGAFESAVFSLADITDQQERQQELDRTRRRLELALETTDTGVYDWDMETDEVTWNDSLERVMGLEPGEFEGTFEAFINRVHPDDRPRVHDRIEQAIETESMYRAEFRMQKADGDHQWVEVRGRVVRDGDGSRMVGVHHDITEQKVRETTLDRQRSLLEAQQEAMIDGLLVVDEHGDIISYNDRFVELWGIPDTVIEQGDEEPALDWVMDRLANPETFRVKVRNLYENPERTSRDEIDLADGRVFDRYTAPVVGDDGTHYGRLWTFRDITQRKDRETELERQNERLEEFTSVASHDLRNPLHTARGRLELATAECDSDHLTSVADAHDRMESIIDGLLWLAREGRDIGTTERVDLTEVVERTWAMTGAGVGAAALSIEADGQRGLRHITADKDRLKRLLENVFRNAIEHGGENVTVRVGPLENGFYVADDGPGIPESEHDAVFDAGDSSVNRGTGFGLSIVKRIAEGHGWTVRTTTGAAGGVRIAFTGIEFIG